MKKYISVRKAAEIDGVSTVTIQNLCRKCAISCRRNGKVWTVLESEVVEYRDRIREIHAYAGKMDDYADQLKQAVEDQTKQLAAIRMFPRRIKAICTVCTELVAGLHSHEELWGDFELSVRETELFMGYLQHGMTSKELADRGGMGVANVNRIWNNALRKFRSSMARWLRLEEENYELHQEIKLKDIEIEKWRLRAQGLDVPEDPILAKMCNLLDTQLCDVTYHDMCGREVKLSARCLNALFADRIDTVRDLVCKHREDMLRYRNFGKKSLNELDCFLEENSLHWGMDLSDYNRR